MVVLHIRSLLIAFLAVMSGAAFAQDAATPPAPAPAEAAPAPAPAGPPDAAAPEAPTDAAKASAYTLMTMVQQGGAILWVIIGLAFIALVGSLYLLLTMSVRREVPKKLIKRAQTQIAAGDLRGAYQMCTERDELLAHVLAAGLKMAGHDRFVIQEAMESEGARRATALWQRIAWLNHIGILAPLLGLLGTVWGMMQAFAAISADIAQVQAIGMAAGVSKAMITTAGGLLLAIPCLAIHYHLRGRVVRIISAVETQANEFIELILEKSGR